MANDEVSIAVVAGKVDMLHATVSDMRLALQDLTQAIITLARVEERQTQLAEAQNRAFKALETLESECRVLETRINALEAAEPEQKRTSSWVTAAVWGAAGLAVIIILKKVGISL